MKKINSIAIVDDDKVTNFLNKRLIENHNVSDSILIFKNGKEVLDYLKDNTIDLIFLDINMPVMTGLEFLSEHKKLPSSQKANTIVVMLTATLMEKDRMVAEKLEINEFLDKPLTKEKLESVIEKYF